MPRHISVWKAVALYLFGVVLFLLGLLSAAGGLIAGTDGAPSSRMAPGLGLAFFGFLIMAVNKLVFKVRRTQLGIDRDETIRDKLVTACPNCGRQNPSGAEFCNSCGTQL